MTLLLKDPEAALDYGVDWGAEYLAGTCLTESELDGRARPKPGEWRSSSQRSTCWSRPSRSAAGMAGRVYRLTNHVVTAAGREDSRSIMLRVEKR